MGLSAKHVIRGSVNFASIQFIGAFLSVFTTSYIARLISREEMAIYGTFFILSEFVNLIRNLGLPNTLLKKFPALIAQGKNEAAERLAKTVFYIIGAGSLLFALGVFLYSGELAELFLKSQSYQKYIILFAPGIFVASVFEIVKMLLWAQQKMTVYALLQAGLALVTQVFAIIGWHLAGFEGFIWGFLLGWLVLTVIGFVYTRSVFQVKGRDNAIKLIRYSFPFYMSTFTRYGLIQADQLLVGILLSPDLLALYFFAKRFTIQLLGFIDSIFIPLSPKLAEVSTNQTVALKKQLQQGFSFMTEILVPALILFAANSVFVLMIFGGSQYVAAAPVLAILTLSLIAYAYYSLYGVILYMFSQPIERLKIEAFPGILNVIFLVILALPLKIIGVAISQMIGLLGGVWWGRRRSLQLFKLGFPWQDLVKSFIIWLPIGVVIYWIQNSYQDLVAFVLSALVGVLCYVYYIVRKGHVNTMIRAWKR